MRFTAFGVILALAISIGFSTDRPALGQRPRPRPNPQPRPLGPTGGGARSPAVRPNSASKSKMATVTVNYTLTFNAEIGKVRTVVVAEEFGEKGEIKKHTRDELMKLKGDTAAEKKLPGYKAEFSDLQVNDVVQVALSTWSNEKPAAKKGKKGKKEPEATESAQDKEPKADAKEGQWVTVGALQGIVTKIEAPTSENKSPKITLKVQGQVAQAVPAQPQPRPGQPVVAQPVATPPATPLPATPQPKPATPANTNTTNTTIEPEKAQVTLILIAPRTGAGKK